MEVNHFDTQLGLYAFATQDINAELHKHPALEIIIAKQGSFKLSTKTSAFSKLSGVIVRANAEHALQAEDTDCSIIMIENEKAALHLLSTELGFALEDHPIIEIPTAQAQQLLTKSPALFAELPPLALDERVQQCQAFIHKNLLNQSIPLAELANLVHLSKSRLSHLFKAQTGSSIQNYIVWVRLKKAIQFLLDDESNLVRALYHSGFHDPAHFNKAFRKMFGLNPSVVYNSSMIQISKSQNA